MRTRSIPFGPNALTWTKVALAVCLACCTSAHAQQLFQTDAVIAIPAGSPATTLGAASPYPLTVAVAGLKHGVAHISVSLTLFYHTAPGDVAVLLVSPDGRACQLMGRCGGVTDAVNTFLTFDDDAPTNLPAAIVSGTFRPTVCSASTFAAPAPSGPYATSLSVFRGSTGNGTWSLYVQDFASSDVGRINNGCTLSIIEAGTPAVSYPQYATTVIPATGTIGSATPYPSNVVVSGLTGKLSGVSVRLHGLTHTYPADIDMLLVGPNGDMCMLMSDVGGSAAVSNIDFAFTHNATLSVGAPLINGSTYKPTDLEPGDPMPAPAPVGPYGTSLSVFNGKDPNGYWSLYIADDAASDVGTLTSWTLYLYTDERCPADFNTSGTLEIQDIFDFLNAWFAGCP
jgi:subtilisin-like proprotein convertase family protein